MNRLKLFATATLMALAFTACDEGTPPPVEPPPPPTPVGTISGAVTIEGTAASGITATLSSGATTTTGSGGNFAFSGVEAGTYTVTISGFPEDATFAQGVTQSATIATDGQNVQLNFAGEYVRSSTVLGNVVAADAMMSGGDGQPETLAGVTVTLGGEHAMGETMETDMNGGFMFTGLRAGTYTVTISDYPEDVSFDPVMVEVTVEVGNFAPADFTGHYIRSSAVEGQVIIEGEGLAGITVTLTGGPSDESHTKMTDADGMYRFDDLRPGDYTVSIDDFDPRDYKFAATSQDVSVDLDDTQTVSFTGVLLRTSGISGRVSVEGTGLREIAVALSGAADKSTMTDVSGQYSFAGLAAGDYTVSIAVASDAYVFGPMSKDTTVADDQSVILNFEGAHATTASVSGQLFLDELDKNDAHDAGEYPLAQAGIPVALVGPGVNEQRISATGPDGTFAFAGLRAGSYQLVVPIDATVAAALAAADIKYGGPGTGYAFDLEVGERKTQAVPFDITHTTINVAVTLKGGDYRGDPIPGASVSFYAGGSKVASGETMASEAGVYASVKVARAGTSNNTVQMMVAADGYFVDPTAGMQAVTWDPQSFVHPAAGANPPAVLNDADIVNLNLNVNVNGATVMTEYGGGEALGGWEISVMSGADAVPGAPTMLDDDGNAAFTTVVAPDALPATFTFAAAEDQDDDLDGGEMYEATGGMYVHNGLKLAGAAVDADPIVVTYTTQTLKVYVHHERDQVRGYTGNVLGGDARASGLVDLEVRQASGNDGRFTSPISSDDWDSRANTSGSRGAYTFAHLPADLDIVVHANAMDGYMLLDLHGLDTYRNMEENGVMGGAFGAMGGWGHTVTLCPLTEVEPTGQDFGKCGSFAVVTTHDVSANVSKNGVRKSGTTFSTTDARDTRASGIEVSLTPVEGKNLAGVGRDFTTASSNDPTTDIDERTDHDFGTMAAGAYALGLTDGWMAMVDGAGAAGALSPLGQGGHGTNVHIDVRPSTATLYGFVRNTLGVGLDNVTVTVNGMTATTDDLGRYIVSGISAVRGQLFVNTERAGYPAAKADSTDNSKTLVPEFGANTVNRWDITLSGANNTVAITGTVTEAGTNAPIKGVEIKVDGKAPLNAGSAQGSGKVTTDDEGKYEAIVEIQPNNDPLVIVKPTKAGYHFIPEQLQVAAIAGSTGTADFTGYAASEIVGLVAGPGGGRPKAEVTVTASWTSPTSGSTKVTTTETGTFSLKVPQISGTVTLSAEPRELEQSDYSDSNYQNLVDALAYTWYDPPATRPGGTIAVIPGQVLQFGTFTGHSVQPRITGVRRGSVREAVTTPTGSPPLTNGEPMDTIVVTWEYDTRSAAEAYSAAGGARPTLTTSADVSNSTVTPAATTTATDDVSVTHKRTTTYTITTRAADYGKIGVTVGIPVMEADGTSESTATSAKVDLAAVPSGVTDLKAVINVTEQTSAVPAHTITASWSGPGSPALEHRIALNVQVGTTTGDWEWVVFDPNAQPGIARNTTAGNAKFGQWRMGGYNLSNGGGNWTDDDSGDTYALTLNELRAVRALRVDTRVDGGEWVKQTPTSSIKRTSTPYSPPSNDASLGAVTVGSVGARYDANSKTYSASVMGAEVTVSVTPDHQGASVKFFAGTGSNREVVMDANTAVAGFQLAVDVGLNTFEIVVTAEDEVTQETYFLEVTVSAAPPSSDATLRSLSVNDEALMADATSGEYAYTAADHNVESVTVVAVPMVVAGTTVEYLDASDQKIADADATTDILDVAVSAGASTVVKVKVTPASRAASDAETYTLTVTVPAAPVAGIVIKFGGMVLGEDDEIDLTEGESKTYTVELATMPDDDVTVGITAAIGETAIDNLTQAEGDDPNNSAFITLSTIERTFTSRNWNIPQDVDITADEDDDDADHEGITLTHTAASDDDDYDEEAAEVEVEITDDDVGGATVTLSEGTRTIGEADAGTANTYTVTLTATDGPTDDVMVSIASGEDDDAVLLSSGESDPSSTLSLTFTAGANGNWEDPQTVTVKAVDNNVDAPNDGSATLTHTAMGGGFGDATFADGSGADNNEVAVTITDDDVAAITVTGLAREIREGAESMIDYTVVLATKPANNVNVLASEAGGYNEVFLFTPDNWNMPQDGTFDPPEDDNEVTETNPLTVNFNGGGYATAEATVRVRDNGAAEVIVSHTALTIAGGTTGSYRLSLTKAPAAGETVTVTVSVPSGTLATALPASVELKADNWEEGMPVEVRALTGAGTFTVSNAATATGGTDPVYGSVPAGSDVTVTVPSS